MTELKEASKNVVLTEVQRNEIASARLELTKALDEMVKAIANNQTLKTQAKNLEEKGHFAAVWGSISGASDRDLATMVKELSGSLETTQKAVQVVLRLQNRKDHVLREFHGILLDKIQKIQADTHTLDANQQSAIDVLCDFQEQIEDQLRHHEAVERHELKLAELASELTQKENELQLGLQALLGQTASLKNASAHLATEVDLLKTDLSAHTALSAQELMSLLKNQQALEESLQSLKIKGTQDFVALQLAGQGMIDLVDGLKRQNASAIDHLGNRLAHMSEVEADLMRRTMLLETMLAGQSSLTGWLKRNAIAICSFVIAGVAFAQISLA